MQARWDIRHIYLYLVCLVTLMMLIFGGAGFARNIAEVFYPQPQSEAPMVTAVAPAETGYDPEELKAQQDVQRQWDRRSTVLGLVGNAALLLVAGPLCHYHWRKVQQAPAAAV
jgi:hypothetical protein